MVIVFKAILSIPFNIIISFGVCLYINLQHNYTRNTIKPLSNYSYINVDIRNVHNLNFLSKKKILNSNLIIPKSKNSSNSKTNLFV